MELVVVLLSFVVCLVLSIFAFKRFSKTEVSNAKVSPNQQNVTKVADNEDFRRHHKKVQPISKTDLKKKPTVASFNHPWLATILKGHSGTIKDFDFSPNGKYLASCDEERLLIVWYVQEFETPSKDHKNFRTNLETDHASCLCFAPDSKSILTSLNHDNRVVVQKLAKRDNGSGLKIVEVEAVEFPGKDYHKMDLISLSVACNGKFLITASYDTTLVVWDLKMQQIFKQLDTKQGNNYCAKVSRCGRFVASSGFTPDVKIWEVNFSKNGDFLDVIRAFELKGHTSGVRAFDFNQDSSRMLTASKDGCWALWDTDVRYRLGEEPKCLLKKELNALKQAATSNDVWISAALAPDSDVAAIGCDRIIFTFCAHSGIPLGQLMDHSDCSSYIPFNCQLKFTADSKFLTAARDKQLLIFHNVGGYAVKVDKARKAVQKATSTAHKERLLEQVDYCDEMLKKFPILDR